MGADRTVRSFLEAMTCEAIYSKTVYPSTLGAREDTVMVISLPEQVVASDGGRAYPAMVGSCPLLAYDSYLPR